MLNTHKLLYILPDVAFIAELLPGKKEHTFTVQAFRQINGEFLTEDTFIAENIEKLISKIDPDEYHVVLPDFLFTNTILEVEETAENKVKAHVQDEVLPKLGLNKTAYYLDTFILTQRQNKSKVQLSALEKSVCQPLVQVCAQKGIHITGVTSLSWTIKSVVSLEPSITLVQVGGSLYLAQHYIGVDQTSQATVENAESLAETIKTLKGAEPSIQTVYLLTNELVEEKLKQAISSTLPVQQLASFKETENQMPSYIKQLVESGMRTLDIPDFKAPVFVLETDGVTPIKTTTTVTAAAVTISETSDSEVNDTELPKPQAPADTSGAIVEPDEESDHETLDLDEEVELEDDDEVEEVLTPPTPPTVEEARITFAKMEEDQPADAPEAHQPSAKVVSETKPAEAVSEASNVVPVATVTSTAITLSRPAEDVNESPSHNTPEHHTPMTVVKQTQVDSVSVSTTKPFSSPAVIKNNNGVGNMVKTIGVMFVVFIITVGVGIGLGLGVLSLTQKTTDAQPSPTPIASAAPTVTPSPVPTPSASTSATVKVDDKSVLVVNATTIAGHAGQTKKQLETAGFKKVVASNAKDEYDKGTYVLMAKQDAALISLLEKATKLTLTFKADASAEDPKGEYAAVIVLAE